MAQVFVQPPKDFSSKVPVAACYLELGSRLLVLRRAKEKKEGGFWCVPGGKVEPGESPLQAAIRELKEETGIETTENEFQSVGCLYIRKPEIDYPYHMFRLVLSHRPKVRLNAEHEEFTWAAAHELEKLRLVDGGRTAYVRYCQSLSIVKRAVASVSSYLILKQEDRILLGLRQNTGYCDGMWSFPAGHVEEGEPASHAMAREAEEELGIRIDPNHLKPVHIIHRQSNRWNIDIFFSCTQWESEIENKEPEKCKKLAFFLLSALPENMVDYNRLVLKSLTEGKLYSELGWI